MVKITVDDIVYEYEVNPVHRNKAPNKSQWTIKTPEEYSAFTRSVEFAWKLNGYAWSLHIVSGYPAYLGFDRDHTTEVFISRFEVTENPAIWHGYPISHRDDTPPEIILNAWMQSGFFTPAKISKIITRKPCSL